MNRQDDQRDAHLLSGAYALHAVSQEEAALVERAAADSEELRAELAGLADTAVLLGTSIPAEQPPASLRASLLAALDSVPQLPPVEKPAVETPAADPVVATPALATGSHVATGRRRVRRRRPAVLLALLGVAALLFGGGLIVDRAVLGPQTEYAAITSAADVQHSSAAVAGGGNATVYWSASRDATAVVLNGVTAPAGKTLQLWSLRGKTVTSEGLYDAGTEFRLLDGTPASGEKLGVSIEPAGGSEQPTKVVSLIELT